MSAYDFYVAQLRFVAVRTERDSPEVSEMMEAIEGFADQVATSSRFEVPGELCRVTGRALAGVAGFLQQHILPETVAAGNQFAERQVRWVIDASMTLTATLTVHAETVSDGASCPVELPTPPDVD